MTTINISPQKLLTAASHALVDAKAEYEKAHKEYSIANRNRSFRNFPAVMGALDTMDMWKCRVNRLENLLAAAKVCDGLVCMSMDDVALVRKYL